MKKLLLFLIILSTLYLAACRKDTTGPSQTLSTLTQLIRSDSSRFSILLKLLSTTHITDTLQSAGAYTLFAPPDSVFLQSGITMDSLTRITAGNRLRMAKYYVSQGSFPKDSFPTGWEKPILQMGLSLDNYQPRRYAWLTRQTALNQYYVNGAPLIQADVAASNGVLHIIGRIIEHTSKDITTTLATDPRFSYGVNFAQLDGNGSPIFSNAFSSSKFQSQNDTTSKTIFYPDSTAWANAAHLNQWNSTQLVYPDYCTVNQMLFEPDFYDLNQQQIATNYVTGVENNQRQTLQFLLNPTPAVLGLLNSQPGTIQLSRAIVTTNGVIYVIDQCLDPFQF